MRIVDEILQKLEGFIETQSYGSLENEKLELKDNSHIQTEWTEVLKTINAFLNTNGGIIIVGIKEDTIQNKYLFTGFADHNEGKVKTIITNAQFNNDEGVSIDASAHVTFEVRNFLDGRVLVIFIDALADDEKFVTYKGKAYKRILTGDHQIPQALLEGQKEYKKELIDQRELKVVANATIADLDVSKLNDYIYLLNTETKLEHIKASIEDAHSFLVRQSMLRGLSPTILGMLVCGKEPGAYLHWSCQVDAYVDVPGSDDIAQNKKVINGTVLALMAESEAFVKRNIQTGISVENGGTRTFEYPERLIRECINNSLAHRDYSINQFININIVPGKHIEIKNPGRFKTQLLIVDIADDNPIPIRRIVPNNPKANNPKLAKVLSVFSKWEGKGLGMATLIGACLDDKIDVPYYVFTSDTLSLYIPKGRLVDENMQALFESYSGYISDKLDGEQITADQKKILSYFYKSQMLNKHDKYTILLTKDNNHLQAVQSLQDAGLIKRHKVSTDIYSVFVTDDNLFKKSHARELKAIFGKQYETLTTDYREVLSFIYERNKYSLDKYPSASDAGTTLWIKKGNATKLEGYERYKRDVRRIVASLEKNKFITKVGGKSEYIVCSEYVSGNLLF